MIEPIGALSLTLDQLQGPTAAQGSVTPNEILQFEEALREAGGADLAPVSIQTAEPVQREFALTQVIGEVIDQLRVSNQGRYERIQEITSDPQDAIQPMEMRDLFTLQFELMKLGLEQDFTTKVADKLSQGAQTLFRNQ